MGRLVAVVALACACSGHPVAASDGGGDGAAGDGGLADDGFRSGSRLKLVWDEYQDDTRMQVGFYDAERKESCFLYSGWADGNAYCVPATATGAIVFVNGCTQPVIQQYVDPSCPPAPPAYAVEFQPTACTLAPAHLYERGAPIAVASYFTQNPDGSCAGPFTSPAGFRYFAIGPEVATSQLVQLQLSAATATTRLSTRMYASADGARLPWLAHDAMLGTDCFVESFAQASAICAPATNAYAYTFHDMTCAQPVVGEPSTCPAPQDIGFYSPRACPGDAPTFYASGGTVASSPLFLATSPTTCSPTSAAPGTTFYQIGAQLPVATLARAADALAGHRLQLVHATATGVTWRDTALWDSQQLTECYANPATDGQTRCLPASAGVTTLYRDPQCMQPIDLVDVPSGPASCGAPTPPKFAAKFVQTGCTFALEPHPIAAAYAGTAYTNPAACTAYAPTGRLFTVGAAVPATAWMSATQVTDP